MGKRLRIGQFARLAHVTIRTLRHYEDEGLLRPSYVRNCSRYRYYDAAQLLTFRRIAALRRVGISIPDIRRLLRGSDGGMEVLQAHRERLRSAIDEQTMQLRQLDAMLSGADQLADGPATCPRVRVIPPTFALCRRATVSEVREAVSEMFEGAEAAARSNRIDASPFLLLHTVGQLRGSIDIEVCIPVDPHSRHPDVREVEGEFVAGCLVYQGEYSQTDRFFGTMHRWIERAGAVASGPRREIYHRFGADEHGYRLPGYRLASNPADYVTELQMPFTPAPR